MGEAASDDAFGALLLRESAAGVEFEVRVAPRAARAAIRGLHAGALKVSLTAPPVDGAANEALIELLASVLGVSKRALEIVRGQRSRSKAVAVRGLGAQEVRAVLAAHAMARG